MHVMMEIVRPNEMYMLLWMELILFNVHVKGGSVEMEKRTHEKNVILE